MGTKRLSKIKEDFSHTLIYFKNAIMNFKIKWCIPVVDPVIAVVKLFTVPIEGVPSFKHSVDGYFEAI